MNIQVEDLQRATEAIRDTFACSVTVAIEVWAYAGDMGHAPAMVYFDAYCHVTPPLPHMFGESPGEALANLEQVLKDRRALFK